MDWGAFAAAGAAVALAVVGWYGTMAASTATVKDLARRVGVLEEKCVQTPVFEQVLARLARIEEKLDSLREER